MLCNKASHSYYVSITVCCVLFIEKGKKNYFLMPLKSCYHLFFMQLWMLALLTKYSIMTSKRMVKTICQVSLFVDYFCAVRGFRLWLVWLSWLHHHSIEQGVVGLIMGQSMYLCCGFSWGFKGSIPGLGTPKKATNWSFLHRCYFSLSLPAPFSNPLPLSPAFLPFPFSLFENHEICLWVRIKKRRRRFRSSPHFTPTNA